MNIIRFGVSIEERLLKKFDSVIAGKGYVNRSEAVRDLIRDLLETDDLADAEAEVIGTLTFIYSHEVREISDKLNDIQHHHYTVIISSTHIHMDEHNCMEVLILRGKAGVIQTIADNLLSLKNIKHGKLTTTAASS
ncbi:MAG: nickel-responsive transcriptional regulator NikR [Spirochaetes bacterium]|jgi:CopG family nickel-responsive transcriptional regulator|nr:nickel-responsive transcriptional regulator NikR [Spirochaetota bacterium]